MRLVFNDKKIYVRIIVLLLSVILGFVLVLQGVAAYWVQNTYAAAAEESDSKIDLVWRYQPEQETLLGRIPDSFFERAEKILGVEEAILFREEVLALLKQTSPPEDSIARIRMYIEDEKVAANSHIARIRIANLRGIFALIEAVKVYSPDDTAEFDKYIEESREAFMYAIEMDDTDMFNIEARFNLEVVERFLRALENLPEKPPEGTSTPPGAGY